MYSIPEWTRQSFEGADRIGLKRDGRETMTLARLVEQSALNSLNQNIRWRRWEWAVSEGSRLINIRAIKVLPRRLALKVAAAAKTIPSRDSRKTGAIYAGNAFATAERKPQHRFCQG